MSAPGDNKTNILFLFCDEMRWDCLGVMGNKVIQTPNLDKLASQGMVFKNAYSTAPLCVPARAQIITGLPCWETNVWGLADRVVPSMRTFMHTLNEQGYFTGAVGKMHFRPTRGGGSIREPHGFQKMVISEECVPQYDLSQYEDDYYQYLLKNGYGPIVGRYPHGRRSPDYGIEGYHAQISELPLKHFDTTWTADETIRMLEEHAYEPFFIWCSFVKPHFPCELPKDWPCPYRPEDIPFRDTYTSEPNFSEEEFSFIADCQRSTMNAGWLDEKTIRNFAAYYYGNITLIDMQIGRIMDKLEQLGLTDTLIIFSSDHGENLGERGMVGKFNFYDESCKVPMIAAGPMVSQPGTVDERPVILEDMCPTFIDTAGAPTPGNLIGESMLPLLRDVKKTGRKNVFGVAGGLYHFEPQNAHCFVQTNEWKYMYQFAGGSEKLFNTQEDPLELNNLATQHRALCETLNQRIAEWLIMNNAHFLTKAGKLRKDLLTGSMGS